MAGTVLWGPNLDDNPHPPGSALARQWEAEELCVFRNGQHRWSETPGVLRCTECNILVPR